MKKEDDSSMKKYKSDAQRKAVHASKAERGMTMKKEEAMKMKKPLKAAKPDYIDLDGDGNKTESMKQAAADKKAPPTKMQSPAKDKMSSTMVGEKTAKIHNEDYANNPDHNKNMHGKGRNTSIADNEKKKRAMKMKKGEAMNLSLYLSSF